MTEPPEFLDGARVLEVAFVDDRVTHTGRTNHWRNGELLPAARALVIAAYDDTADEFYLFYCDEDWNVRNDTYHTTLHEARSQAEYEYSGITAVWVSRSPSPDSH